MYRKYLAFVQKSFLTNFAYRIDCLAGIINSVLMSLVNIAIWKALYEEEAGLEGVQFKILVTYIIFSFLLQCLFFMHEYQVEEKIRSGLIASDLLKPMNFRLYIFAFNLGTLCFRVVTQLIPILAVGIFCFRILPPFSPVMGLLALASMILGYLILFNLNFIVWICSFWFVWIFSLVTIKDALVMILSGAILPLWFMPSALRNIIRYTPFDTIYFVPISIYLGQIPEEEILFYIIKQVSWIAILFVLGTVIWKRAARKLVVQGG